MRLSLRFAAVFLFLGSSSPAMAHPGWGIVVDRHSQVYFTDLSSIWRIDPQGRLTRVVTGKHSHALYLDEASNVYGEHLTYDGTNDRWWTSLWKLTPEGVLVEVIPPTEGARSSLPQPTDSRGNAYFWESALESKTLRIYRKAPDGTSRVLAGGEWGEADGQTERARFGRVTSLVVGPRDVLYLIDGSSVRQATPEGAVTTLARNLVRPTSAWDPAGGGGFNRLMSLAVDPAGNIYVANYGNRCVLKITPQGEVSAVLRSRWLWSPSGVVVAHGAVYVLEYTVLPPSRARVRRVSSDGSVLTLASTAGVLHKILFFGAPFLLLAFLFAAVWSARMLLRRQSTRQAAP